MSLFTPFAFYGGELWFPLTASGGQIFINSSSWDGENPGPYAYHVFTASGDFTVTDTGSDGYVEMFLVGGGGGGKSGGGGGGGIYQEYQYTVVSGSLTITIGAGGTGGTGDTANNASGSDSTISGSGFLTAISKGGGKAGPNNTLNNTVTSQGGSGGGGGAGGVAGQINLGGNAISGSLGTYQTKHGSPGGNAISGSTPVFAPAGGGGFFETGQVNPVNSQAAGYGGEGSYTGGGFKVNSFWFADLPVGFGDSTYKGYFAGGGGGRRSDAQPTIQGLGGRGGGGNGNLGSGAGGVGQVNTGGGGGGAAAGGIPGSGGSGICIIRYRLTNNQYNPFTGDL